jgi:hypothetical protein
MMKGMPGLFNQTASLEEMSVGKQVFFLPPTIRVTRGAKLDSNIF